jgi:hypothetical protein
MTIRLEFPPDTLSILNDERYTHPVPLVQRRMEALWLKSHNLPQATRKKYYPHHPPFGLRVTPYFGSDG